MADSNELITRLIEVLPKKKGKKFYSEYLGVSMKTLESIWGKAYALYKKGQFTNGKCNTQTQSSDKEIKIKGYYAYPPTSEQIISDHGIDITKWKLSSFWSKQKSMGYQISAFFVKIGETEEEKKLESLLKALENHKTDWKPIPKSQIVLNDKFNSPSCALISLPDTHLDKLEITGTKVEDKIKAYTEVLKALTYRAYSSHYLEEIVYVIGNDYFHSDRFAAATTKGTPLEVNETWDAAYEKGFKHLVECISFLKGFCNKLTVILVPGNHARTKEYYLAHALEVKFSNDNTIEFKRKASDRKVHQFGETLLCFSHGNNINDKLPLVFATEFYKEWGKCKFKEIILGDKHHNSEKMIKSQGEANGVRMRILPALSGTDTWHDDNLYTGALQAGVALIYDKKKGKYSEFEERI